jgi:hypothetical protein
MNKKSFTRVAGALTITAGLAFAITVPAQASGGGGGVQHTGQCSAGSIWTLKAKADDAQIEAEAEVDSNVVGQVWKWKISDNGTVAAKGTSTTTGPSGSFTVNRLVPNQAGADKFVLKASNAASGETCKGNVTL